jgi:hypothetical protein
MHDPAQGVPEQIGKVIGAVILFGTFAIIIYATVLSVA